MAVNILAINVGNSRVQVAAVLDGRVHGARSVDPDHLAQLDEAIARAVEVIGDADGVVTAIGSVNASLAERVAGRARAALDRPVQVAEADFNVPVGRRLDPETLVGADRLLNAAAAYDTAKQACVVVDAGTAVTIDFVDGEGTFHGGAILPGVRMMLQALDEKTAQLPEVAFKPPREPIGHNTAEAMLAGVYHGIRGAVRELAEKYAEEYGAYPRIIATGGDAETLFDGYELVEAIVPELTLQGLAVARRHQLAADADAEG